MTVRKKQAKTGGDATVIYSQSGPEPRSVLTAAKQQYVSNGAYGCVLKPAVPCSGPGNPVNPRKTSKNTVSKLFLSKHDRDDELSKHKGVEAVDPEGTFTITLLDQCSIPSRSFPIHELTKCENLDFSVSPGKSAGLRKSQLLLGKESLYQIIYEYGGVALDDTTLQNEVTFYTIFEGFERVLKGLETLAKRRLVHMDIKPANILYNTANKKMALIDFGLSRSKKELYTMKTSGFLLAAEYLYYPPEMNLYHNIYSSGMSELIQAAKYPIKSISKSTTSSSVEYDFIEETCVNYLDFMRHYLKEAFANNQTFSDEYKLFLHGYKNDYKRLLKTLVDSDRKSIKSLLTKSAHKVDVYSVGISMLEVFLSYVKIDPRYLDRVDFVKRFLRLVYNMTNVNVFTRHDATSALKEYAAVKKLIPNLQGHNLNYSFTWQANTLQPPIPKPSARNSLEYVPRKRSGLSLIDEDTHNSASQGRLKPGTGATKGQRKKIIKRLLAKFNSRLRRNTTS